MTRNRWQGAMVVKRMRDGERGSEKKGSIVDEMFDGKIRSSFKNPGIETTRGQ